jgi:hypothetical protein
VAELEAGSKLATARESLEAVVAQYPASQAATLAKGMLQPSSADDRQAATARKRRLVTTTALEEALVDR